MILITSFLSIFVTNDIALIVVVPLTLALNIDKRDILVILEAIVANASSSLSPIGNPQNLYIYWFYRVPFLDFIVTIAPLAFIILLLSIIFLTILNIKSKPYLVKIDRVEKRAYIYGLFFIAILLNIFHIAPTWLNILIFLFALLFDRRALRVDYTLLISLTLFFAIASNLESSFKFHNLSDTFLLSALVSQILSNVPTAILFAKFSANWKALLWGVNVGGFGSLVGSLANLIAYKIFITQAKPKGIINFTIKFLAMGYLAFFISIGLYYILY